MENKNELSLLRPRSMSAVVSDGYRLYMGTFRSLFRSSWVVAVVYALTFALFMGNLVNNVLPMQMTLQSADGLSALPPSVYYSVAVTVLYILAVTLLAAQAVSVFREHKATGDITFATARSESMDGQGEKKMRWYGRLCLKSFIRLLPVAVWMLIAGAVSYIVLKVVATAILSLGLVGSLWKSIASLALLAIVMFIIIAICIPLYYTVMRTLLADGKVQIAPPLRGYGLGLRHWGLLFATVLVVCVLTGLLTLVCELPAVIMAAANAMAYVGLAKGDPLGMPENMVPLTYAVFFVAGFIQAYVHLSTLYPLYYAYGSIEEMKNIRDNISSQIV